MKIHPGIKVIKNSRSGIDLSNFSRAGVQYKLHISGLSFMKCSHQQINILERQIKIPADIGISAHAIV